MRDDEGLSRPAWCLNCSLSLLLLGLLRRELGNGVGEGLAEDDEGGGGLNGRVAAGGAEEGGEERPLPPLGVESGLRPLGVGVREWRWCYDSLDSVRRSGRFGP